MPIEPHWSSLRRRRASTDRPPPSTRSWNASHARHEFNRRLTLGDMGEWLREKQEPAQSVTLGDVGDWFKSKLPSHRPERGGTLRNKEDQEKGVTSGIRLASVARKNGSDSSANWPLSEQSPVVNRRTGQQSGTGGSDRLVDWNTPKDLGELLTERSLSSKGKATTIQKLPSHRRWKNLNSPRPHNKLDQKAADDGIGSKKDRQEQMQSNVPGMQLSVPAMQMMPGILEVLEARKKARKKARDDRESLIESGDYLGVQGINPQTGVLDLTSDSGDSALSVRTEVKLANLETQAKNATSAVKRKEAEAEIVKIHFDHDITKLRRREETEKQLAKWRRDTYKWSSVQEPDLSPIAQSNRSVSVLSRRKSRRDYSMPKYESLVDLSLPKKQPSQEERPRITPSINLRSRDSARSSDTVVKTPHRRSLAALSPAALELFENDMSFRSADELGLDRDLFAKHDVTPSIIHAQAASNISSEMNNAREVKESHASNNKATFKPFLDKRTKEQIEPRRTEMLWTTACSRKLPDLQTINLSTVSRGNNLTLVKNAYETSSSREINPQRGFMQDLTTSHKKFTTQPTVSKQIVPEFLENQCRQAADPIGLHQIPTGHALEPSPIVQLLQRRQVSRVGRKVDPLLQKEAERSVTRDPLTALPSPTREATAWPGLRNLPKTAKEIEASKGIVRKNLTQLKMLYQAILEIRDHDNHQICAQNTNQDTTNMYEVKEACASMNTIITTGLNRVVRNLQHFGTTPSSSDLSQTNRGPSILPKPGSLDEIPAADTVLGNPQVSSMEELQAQMCNNTGPQGGISAAQHQCSSLSIFTYTADGKGVEVEETGQTILLNDSAQLGNGCLLSRTDRTGLSEQGMKLGSQMSDSLQGHEDAEDDTADLSSNKPCQSKEGGLWDAIKEFLRTINEYSTWLLRLYFGAVRPVFDTRSSYWSCADREDRGWMDLVSLCLALPLIFGLSMVLVWGMELTVIALKCMDEDQDCMADEALAMFQRSLTGVYPYD
ncbi:hypothetical protein FSPOR_880 [Fusarium sporotrichioides]|uniref:Uncharacterized protein n=1 Tax=Fusarium sporotrichioides TaxID=5514 RepID=A0A395SS02_FUSSP|nr:hypothetical protein FSPOR_880 [Fusarium sporotrichioides]